MFITAQKNSTYFKLYDSNIIDRSEQELKKFLSSDLVLIGECFDNKTGTEPDYIAEDTKDLNFLSGDDELDTFTVFRNHEDLQ